jgi:hypothetical protein|tara:strand:- start:2542 stop:2685 length:144 start_codon:yes stop_codon:yes gene_type:complete
MAKMELILPMGMWLSTIGEMMYWDSNKTQWGCDRLNPLNYDLFTLRY